MFSIVDILNEHYVYTTDAYTIAVSFSLKNVDSASGDKACDMRLCD